MIRFLLPILAFASPAAAQIAPLNFESGKRMTLTSGQWSYVATASGSEARFGSVLAIRCERSSRTVTVERLGSAPAVLTIATSSVTRSLPAGGRLLANDPLLDAIAFSRGRFLVSGGSVAGGAAPILAIPSWPEAARAVEDCRN